MSTKKRPLFAVNLQYLRNQRQLTRQDIFKLTGIPSRSWGSYEEGRAFPSHKKLPAICEALHYYDVIKLITTDLSKEKTEVIITGHDAMIGLQKVKEFLERNTNS